MKPLGNDPQVEPFTSTSSGEESFEMRILPLYTYIYVVAHDRRTVFRLLSLNAMQCNTPCSCR